MIRVKRVNYYNGTESQISPNKGKYIIFHFL